MLSPTGNQQSRRERVPCSNDGAVPHKRSDLLELSIDRPFSEATGDRLLIPVMVDRGDSGSELHLLSNDAVSNEGKAP